MTAGELRAILAALPDHLEVLIMDPEVGEPKYIDSAHRGSWGVTLLRRQDEKLWEEWGDGPLPDAIESGLESYEDDTLYRDPAGEIVVITTY